MKVTLNFKGPYTKNRFCAADEKTKPDYPEGSKDPGVYIWGFEIGGRFIPYYVGKIQSSIQSRISKHIADLIKPKSTYMRLSKDYIEGQNPFYMDKAFPLISTNYSKETLPTWYRENKCYFNDRIAYLNNREFLTQVLKCNNLPSEKQKDYPKSLVIGLEDYFSPERMTGQFRVCFAPCLFGNYVGKEKEKIFYEVLEAFTKFSLRGKTVSKSLEFETLQCKMKLLGIQHISIKSDYQNIFKDTAGWDFPGYS